MFKVNSVVTAKQHPNTKAIITAGTKNPDWGSVRVESEALINNGEGLIVLQTRVAFVRMPMELAQKLIEAKALVHDKPFPMEGRIIVKESLEPFYDGQSPKINPTTNETIMVNGTMPVYRQSFFVSDESSKDVLIADYLKANPINVVRETVGDDVPVTEEQTVG